VAYRRDIDGLRAVSVLSVIAFHLNVGLPGGYVGVDVFFVISGFLIGGIVFREIDAGSFSFTAFYERRIRRIFPALAVILLLSGMAARRLMGDAEIVSFARSALAALLSVANIYFYQTSGYFAAISSDVPLLHLWSLGVEEQFYIVFPLAAVLLTRFRPAWLLAIGAASLISCQIGLHHTPQASFYLLQNRAVELIIGILLTRLPLRRTALGELAAAVLGVILLGFALTKFNESTHFPGVAALVPCIGAASVIWSGEKTVVGRMLAVSPVRYIGKISYPMYLVHWPLIVFGRIAMPRASGPSFAVFVFVGTVIAAAAIYHLVERPIQRGSKIRLWRFTATAAAVLLAMVGSIFMHYGTGPSSEIAELYLEGSCFLKPDQDIDSFAARCFPAGRPDVILLGDSHAAHLYNGMRDELAKHGYSLGMFAASACPPLSGYKVEARPYCENINRYALSVVEARRPTVVILSAFWKPSMVPDLERALHTFSKISGTSVVVIGNTPVFEESVPIYLGRHIAQPIGVSDRSAIERLLREKFGAGDLPGVKYVPLSDLTCPGGRCALTDEGGVPYYLDDGHLTKVGSHWLARQVVPNILGSSHPTD
jgi:peptidoglycan/LPS O-acetylase OafA/YrhL